MVAIHQSGLEPRDHAQGVPPSSSIVCTLTLPPSTKVLIFIFILFSTPTNGDASGYFYTNELKMSAKVPPPFER
jgi:hypothetical protein